MTARARLSALVAAVLLMGGAATVGVSAWLLDTRLSTGPEPDQLLLFVRSDDEGAAAPGEGARAPGATEGQRRIRLVGPPPTGAVPDGADVRPLSASELVTGDGRDLAAELRAYSDRVRMQAVRQLVVQSVLAVVALAAAAALLAHALAGRVLRPVHAVAALARRIGAGDLHERVPPPRPGRDGDELGDLVDTVNGMLDRLERSFAAQRRFLANAGHELRTPVAVQRTVLEVHAGTDAASDVRDLAGRLMPLLERQQRTVDGLLTLAHARSLTDAARGEDVATGGEADLLDVVAAELDAVRPAFEARGQSVVADLPEAARGARADRALVELVVRNLLGNAAVHPPVGSPVAVRAAHEGDAVVLDVVTEGPVLDAEAVAQWGEPFRRGERTGRTAGVGLGLAIATDAAAAAGGTLELSPRESGGLAARLVLPAVTDSAS